MLPVEELSPDSADYPEALKFLFSKAVEFLNTISAFDSINRAYLCWGFPKVSLFLVDCKLRDNNQLQTWVVVGETPPAILDTEYCPDGLEAFKGYIGEIMAWVAAVKEGNSLDGLMPVLDENTLQALPPTKKNAEIVEAKALFIRNNILDSYHDDLKSCRYRKD